MTKKATAAARKVKARKNGKLPGLLDCPLEIIGLISAALVKDQDELRTIQVVAADLISLGTCCKALNTQEFTDAIWDPLCKTCPPAPACPLDMGMEVIEQPLPPARRAPPPNVRTTRQSSKGAVPQQSKPVEAACWSDVVMCLEQAPEMVSYEALNSLRRSLNIAYTSLMSPAALRATVLSRLPPKGCNKPLAAVLVLRKEATTYMSKQEARMKYYITDAGFRDLTRVDASLVRGAGYRKYDIVMAAKKRYRTKEIFRARAARSFPNRRRYHHAPYYYMPPQAAPALHPAAQQLLNALDMEEDPDYDDEEGYDEDEENWHDQEVCPYCGAYGCRGIA